jgi:hypothetical protein
MMRASVGASAKACLGLATGAFVGSQRQTLRSGSDTARTRHEALADRRELSQDLVERSVA